MRISIGAYRPEREARLDNLNLAEWDHRAILAYFKDWDMKGEDREFLRYHCRRYEFLVKKVNDVVRAIRGGAPLKILDIGPYFQTEIFRRAVPGAVVDTVGFENPAFKGRPQERHFEFDLNDAPRRERWPKIEAHDLIVMAEVIEHLHISPVFALRCVASWLKSGGYLIIQTPNACALHKRIRMVIGKNPYPMPREVIVDPAHFREYTVEELISIGGRAGFAPAGYSMGNYFGGGEASQRAYNILGSLLPAGFRRGITIVFKKL